MGAFYMQNKEYEGQKKQIHIADTNHETILISDIEKEVISTKLFNRLHHVSQNSTVYLTFPSNKTKRFEHSIGTMKLCGDMFYSAICNTSSKHLEGLLHKIKRVIIDKIVEGEALSAYREQLGDNAFRENKKCLKKLDFSGLSNSFYNRCIPRNLTKSQASIYLLTFQAIRLCGLLHDLGHPPFSHVIEASMDKIYNELKKSKKRQRKETEYLQILAPFYDKTEKSHLHEEMGNRMVSHLCKALLSSQYLTARYGKLSFEDTYFRILVFLLTEKIFNDKNLRCLYSIISGPIDGDRLDYVNRDIANSGLNSGKVEYIRLLSSCCFMFYDNKDYVLAFHIKTVNTIEDFFFKRWFLYKNIIYHHRVSKTDKLLQLCIEDIMHGYLNNNSSKAQNRTNLLPDDISGLWKSIADSDSNEEYFDYLIQWDDNWLLTVLKHYYFKIYYRKNALTEQQKQTAYKLEELLSNKKNYYSLIKNKHDFTFFSKVFEKLFCEIWAEIYSEYTNNKEENSRGPSGLLIFLKIRMGVSIDNLLEMYLENFIDDTYKGELEDGFLVIKEAKDGLDVEPFVYNSEESPASELSQFSNIKRILTVEKTNFPYFYIYIKFCENVNIHIKDIQQGFLEKFAEYTVKKMQDIADIQNILKGQSNK